jgi:uncharacterized OB-fold protein
MQNTTIFTNKVQSVPSTMLPLLDIDVDACHLRLTSEGMRLIGSNCRHCEKSAFPVRQVCCYCGQRDMTAVVMTPGGNLYSFTTVHISADRRVPYTIGYVDLDNGVRILAAICDGGQGIVPDCRVRLDVDNLSFRFVTTVNE